MLTSELYPLIEAEVLGMTGLPVASSVPMSSGNSKYGANIYLNSYRI